MWHLLNSLKFKKVENKTRSFHRSSTLRKVLLANILTYHCSLFCHWQEWVRNVKPLLKNVEKCYRPTFTQKTLRSALAVYEFCVTRNSFWAGFLLKSISIFRLLFPGIILWLWRPNVFFSLLLRLICFLPNETSQLKMLYGYSEGKYCQCSSQWSLCYGAKKRRFDESLVLDAGPWQVG